MLALAHAGLTTPAVAGPGCNEGLGVIRDRARAAMDINLVWRVVSEKEVYCTHGA